MLSSLIEEAEKNTPPIGRRLPGANPPHLVLQACLLGTDRLRVSASPAGLLRGRVHFLIALRFFITGSEPSNHQSSTGTARHCPRFGCGLRSSLSAALQDMAARGMKRLVRTQGQNCREYTVFHTLHISRGLPVAYFVDCYPHDNSSDAWSPSA